MGTPQPPRLPIERNAEQRSRPPDTQKTENPETEQPFSDHIGVTSGKVPNSIDFADELANTTRYLVQHALITMIFALKLCALPLVYSVDLLAGSSDLQLITAASFPQSPNAILDQVSIRDRKDTNPRPILAHIVEAAILPFRMTQTLYKIGNILQRYPELLSQLGSRIVEVPKTAKAYDLGNQDRRVLSGASTHNLVDTEIYHATLSEPKGLDEILAAFDLDSSSHESLVSDEAGQVPEGSVDHKRVRSLQNTPPEVHRSVHQLHVPGPMKMSGVHPNGFACFESVSHRGQESIAPSSAGRTAYTSKAWDARIDDRRHMSVPEQCVSHDMKELLGDANGLDRCPTYVRRHRRSLLPRRLGTQSAVDLGYGGSGASQETLPIRENPPPRKGTRLKKKRPVEAVAKKSSVATLLRKF